MARNWIEEPIEYYEVVWLFDKWQSQLELEFDPDYRSSQSGLGNVFLASWVISP